MPEIATFSFAECKVGQQARFEVVLTADMVARFAELSGDHNPLHMDESYASQTQFKGRIAHGMLGASFFSQLVGMHLPGRYALYLSQSLLFRSPMRLGMRLFVEGVVMQKVESTHTLNIKTEVLDAETTACLIRGEAIVKVLQ